jgi:hypothetical protein
LTYSIQSTLEENGIDPASDDEFEIDWFRRQLADASGARDELRHSQ